MMMAGDLRKIETQINKVLGPSFERIEALEAKVEALEASAAPEAPKKPKTGAQSK